MASDKNGKPLQVGDQVIIRATVRSVAAGDHRYNIGVDTDEVLYPETIKVGIHLNGKQVEKVRKTQLMPAPTDQ